MMKDLLTAEIYFPCPVYTIEKLEFLEDIRKVSYDLLNEVKKIEELDEIHPVLMTKNIWDDVRSKDFINFVGSTSWNILNEQGYNMENQEVFFTEMWVQEHHKYSSMEQHVHGMGSQLVGFYFLDVPENSSLAIFHDPRPGKVQSSLLEKDSSKVTIASGAINFIPRPGLLIFSNSWLPHSFSRHSNKEPIRFVHFNVSSRYMQNQTNTTNSVAEVV